MYSINPPLEGCIRTVGFLQLLRNSRDFASAHRSRLCPQPLAPRLPPFFGWTLQSYSPTVQLPLQPTSAQKERISPDERRFNTVGECKSYGGGLSIGTQWSGIGKSESSSLEWENQTSNPLVEITKARLLYGGERQPVRLQELQRSCFQGNV